MSPDPTPRPALALLSALGRPLRFRATNLILREARAAAGAVAALAVLQVVIALLPAISSALDGKGLAFDLDLFLEIFVASGVVTGFLLGVLCGAEEQENRTADFALRLPIPRWHILAEKIAGSGVAFLLWVVVSLGLGVAAAVVCGSSFHAIIERIAAQLFRHASVWNDLRWAVLFYCFGLAAGAWIGRVILAAVAGGLAAVFYIYVGLALALGQRSIPIEVMRGGWAPPVLWVGCLAALAVAAARFQTREGT